MIRISGSHKILFAVLAAVCLITSFAMIRPVQADEIPAAAEKAFDSMLEKLNKDGVVSSTDGDSTYWGDYTDEWAQIGWYQWITFEHTNRFVFSANVSWDSASQTPNNFESGCGLMFNIGNGNSNHLLASIRMDGMIYFTGIRNSNYLSYGTYRYGKSSIKGSADYVVVVDNDKATVYIDGERVVRKADLPVMGDGVGLSTLSGKRICR